MKNEKRIIIKFYCNGKYLPTYDKEYIFDLDDEESFRDAWVAASYKIYEVSEANGDEITARIEVERGI